jgi:thioredoxin-like negative regulator of GroEL
VALGGCGATPPVPTEKLAHVETAIAGAKDKEAYTYAAAELMQAEQKYSEAKRLIEQEKMEQAARLLDQALSDAKLAEAKADSARAARQANEMRDTIETLRQEVERQ